MSLSRRGKVYYWDAYDAAGKRTRTSLKTTDKAEAKERAKAIMVAVPKPQVTGSPTLKSAFTAAKLEHAPWRTAKAPLTLEGNYKAVSTHFGEDCRLSAIGDDEVRAWTQTMLAAGLSASSINQRLSLVSVLFEWALETHPNLRRPRLKRQPPGKPRERRVTRDEEAEVIRLFGLGVNPRDADMADLVQVLADVGCRLSEALRLRDVDCDLKSGIVAIWENKADHPRGVPMTQRVKAIFARRAYLGTIFGTLTVDFADDRWAWARTRMALDEDKQFVLHALRHATGTRLAELGFNALQIMQFLGHKQVSTTQIYVNMAAHDLKGLAVGLDRAHNPSDQECDQVDDGMVPLAELFMVARYAEGTVNPQVPGSSPGRGAKLSSKFKGLRERSRKPFVFSACELRSAPQKSFFGVIWLGSQVCLYGGVRSASSSMHRHAREGFEHSPCRKPLPLR